MRHTFLLQDLVLEFGKELAPEHPVVHLWKLFAGIEQDMVSHPHVLANRALIGSKRERETEIHGLAWVRGDVLGCG